MIKKPLTKAEEQIMQYVWEIERGFLKDIVEKFPEPKPAYTTVSTVIRVLVKKNFIGYRTYGKTNEYYPLISKESYSKASIKNLVKSYFGGSFSDAVSFMIRENNLSVEDLENLLQQTKKGKK